MDELYALRENPYALLLAMEEGLGLKASGEIVNDADAWVGLGFATAWGNWVCPREEVKEVIIPPDLTRVPGAKPWLLGVANVRGGLLPVLDLGQLLHEEPMTISRDSRVLIFNSENTPAGFLVNSVLGYRQFEVSDQRMALVEDAEKEVREFILGAFVRDGQPWMAMSLHKLASSEAFQNASI